MRIMTSFRSAGNRGFSLVEAIIVMAILSIVMMAIMSFIIPTQQSMKMQSNVTDVQSNINLAMNVITRDLLTAGFMVEPAFDPPVTHASCPPYWKGDTAGDDMQPGPIFWQGNDTTDDNDDLTIRTRVLGNAFAVIDSVAAGVVTPTHADMFDNFCRGNTVKVANVRIFNPITMKEAGCTDYPCEMAPAATIAVNSCNNAAKTFTLNAVPAEVSTGYVVIGARSNTDMPLHTIRYRVRDNALERLVDGNSQILARGVTAAAFAYGRSSSGNINRVDVTLTGVIAAMKGGGDAQLSQKTRALTTTVNLRNTF